MRKLILMIIGIIAFTLSSEAQLVRSRTFAEKKKTGYNIVSVGYDAMFLDQGYGTLNGVNLQYLHGFRVTKKVPLFLEIGADISYNTKSYKSQYQHEYGGPYYTSKFRRNIISGRIPLNVSYKFNIVKNFHIQPYTGLNFRINGFVGNGQFYGNNTFQGGWQIGLGFNVSKLYLGLQYGLDFLPIGTDYTIGTEHPYHWIERDINSSRLLVSIGVNF